MLKRYPRINSESYTDDSVVCCQQLKETESTAEKLQAALTQLSNKFVTSRLDKGGLRHYQEQCAKFETLYNAVSHHYSY